MPHGGVGHRLADLCARLATWLHVPAKENGERGPRSITQRVAPHRPLLLAEWVGGGAKSTKPEQLTQNSKLKLAVRHFYLLPVRHNLLPGRWALLYDGLGYSGSEPGKSMYPLGDLRHVSLHEPSLGDFDAASTGRYTTYWWPGIAGRLRFYGAFSDFRVVFLPRANYCWRGRGRAKWTSQHATLAKHTKHVGICAVAITNIQSLEQDVENRCVDMSQV